VGVGGEGLEVIEVRGGSAWVRDTELTRAGGAGGLADPLRGFSGGLLGQRWGAAAVVTGEVDAPNGPPTGIASDEVGDGTPVEEEGDGGRAGAGGSGNSSDRGDGSGASSGAGSGAGSGTEAEAGRPGGGTTKPASLLLVKGETGWRLRAYAVG
jgi:hypothetical protein